MALAVATWSPSSPQLRLALNCRNCRKAPSFLVRTKVGKLDRQISALRVAPSGNGGERRRDEGSWIGSDSKVDTFAGWSKSEGGGGDSIGWQRKKWFRGIVGARVTGIVIVAGLTFATLSLTKRNSSRPKQQVEPLTTQQETLLAGLDVDIAINNASIREDLQYYLAFDGTPVAPQNIRSLPKLPESEIVGGSSVDYSFKDSDGSVAASKLEKASELNENLINVEPTKRSVPNANPTNLYTDQQDEMPGSVVSATPIVHAPNDPIVVVASTSSELKPTLEPQIVPKDDKDNVISSSIKENLELNKKQYVSIEGNGSSSEVHNLKEIKNSNVPLDFSSTPIVHALNDPVGVSVSTSSELKPTLEPQVVPKGDKDNVMSSSIKENLDLSKKSHVSVEGNGSSSEVQNLNEIKNSNVPLDFSSTLIVHAPNDPIAVSVSTSSKLEQTLEPQVVPKDDKDNVISSSIKENVDLSKKLRVSVEGNGSSSEVHNLNEIRSSGTTPISASTYPFTNEQDTNIQNEMNRNISVVESPKPRNTFSSVGIPAPSVVSAALQVLPGKVLVPSVVDQVQGQALSALQMLKVIESNVQPRDLCTRREYARWLVSASGALSRNSTLKVYPAMYIENVTELAYDDITPDDPDFASIQGLAEAGLISSKLSRSAMLASSDEDQSPLHFYPESPLSRQDLVSWKMALEKRQLPETDRKSLFQLSGFLDTGKINPDAYSALVADISAERGITALAFGYTRLFQPDKPVTKAQAAIALATGEASDVVSEELARIAAESMALNDVAAHSALVAQVEKDIKASFEEDVSIKREKIDAVEKMAEEARHELERLKAEREVDNVALMKERAAVESQMAVHSRLRDELEEKLQSLTRNKVEVSYEMERISKLKKEIENENNKISHLQHELENERKALSIARARAEGEAKSAREQAKALEEVRKRWERQGIKIDGNNLVNKVKVMAGNLKRKTEEKSRQKAGILIMKMVSRYLASTLKSAATKARTRGINELKNISTSKAKESAQKLQQSTAEFRLAMVGQVKRVHEDWREGVEKFAQKFKK